ncbi:probable cytochrome P450 313a2 [Drosophila bipectinata]|uniref:probable cytochrome P450 313a2 n=1 Tax=Drosophila bipectinata TaxID=42026 RepID=UPI001C8ABCC5|nr:probable cytochrome P450 313a2 [Drosophila bipectinata]
MLSIYLLSLVGILVWIHFLWTRRRFYKLMFQIPGPMGLPLIGVAAEYGINKVRIIKRTKYLDNYGSTILTWVGITPVIVTRDPKIAEDILTSPNCLNRTWRVASAIEDLFGIGLLTLQGTEWAARRKHMNSSFKHNVLLSFLPIFNFETRALVAEMDNFVGQGEKDLLKPLLRWSLRIAHQTTLGAKEQNEKNFKNNSPIDSWEHLIILIVVQILLPICRNKTISNLFGLEKKKKQEISKISSLMDPIIGLKLNSEPESGTDSAKHIVINRIMELYRKDEIGLQEVKGECYNMVGAAFETTALTVHHTLILLAMFPKYQDIVFEELEEVFPAGGDFEVEHENLQKLVYLDRVLNETMRLIPSVPILARDTQEDFQLSNGVLVPKGVAVFVDIFNMHRNKDLWGPEADTFNPDNFLPENVRERHPYAFMPFSKGKRNCIGWRYAMISSKIALTQILRSYKLSTSFRYEDLVFVDNISMKLTISPPISFHRRNTEAE